MDRNEPKGVWKLYNNGEVTKRFNIDEPIPEGWVPGYPEKRRQQILETRKKTNRERFGSDIVFQSDYAKDKIKQTNLERYGVENVFQSDYAKEKSKKTCLEKYGTEYANQSDVVKEKAKKTNLERYGVEHTFQAESVKEKITETLVERYGVEHPLQSEELMERMRQHNREKYGVDYAYQADEVKEKTKQTCLEKYGVEYALQAKEVRDKIKQTNLEKYGVECNFQSEDTKQKKKQTYLEHYGVEHPSQAEEIKEKKRQTNLERYGVEYSIQSDEVRKRARESSLRHYGTEFPTQSEELKKKISQTCQEKYGVSWACMRPECKMSFSNHSGPNKLFEELLQEAGIPYEREFPLQRYVFDFKVDNTLIEINPTATHNSLWNPFNPSERGLDLDYHQKKSDTAEKEGYRVIHIFEWESMQKVVNLLSARDTIYARNTEIHEVSKDECGDFLKENHMQGSCKGQDIRLGLYVDSQLISIMTFGNPRYNKNYEYELLRYCSSHNVIGGAERLFKLFTEKYQPKNIISYCDRSKFSGEVYTKLGFCLLKHGTPSKHWHNPNSGEHLTDNLVRQKGFDQLFKTNYGKGTDNERLLIEHGFVSVYDCGQDTYVWGTK